MASLRETPYNNNNFEHALTSYRHISFKKYHLPNTFTIICTRPVLSRPARGLCPRYLLSRYIAFQNLDLQLLNQCKFDLHTIPYMVLIVAPVKLVMTG